MEDQKYYLAERGCSQGIQDRLMLAVTDLRVRIFRGESRDQFRLNSNGEPVCVTWNGRSLAYSIRGPLTDEEVKELIKKDSPNGYSGSYFSTLEKRVNSVRGIR